MVEQYKDQNGGRTGGYILSREGERAKFSPKSTLGVVGGVSPDRSKPGL